MTYNFELDVTTNVDAETVENIVLNVVEERTGKKVDRVLTKLSEGKFNGFEIHFQTEISDTPKREKIFDKSFKVFKWDS